MTRQKSLFLSRDQWIGYEDEQHLEKEDYIKNKVRGCHDWAIDMAISREVWSKRMHCRGMNERLGVLCSTNPGSYQNHRRLHFVHKKMWPPR
ncbi:hypothetical protein JTE90_013643 [Oedothorax gibbosus]|uniref:Uncharacterized protein n=1 Tax=Oedothorax gibbosus TaxID=931172 RepID=A0AAV6TDW4_9ARAC|nr:hypothetical protein JTE90_013643 [Oedothorax gibbosus]